MCVCVYIYIYRVGILYYSYSNIGALITITNCDYATNQAFNQKMEGIASEMLAALHFVQSELAEVKQTISSTIEEVHSIREMCERPLPASAPQYRAPHFAAQIPGPAPLYEAAVSARSLSLQSARIGILEYLILQLS